MAFSTITAGAAVPQITAVVPGPTSAILTTVQSDVSLTVGGVTPDMVVTVNWPNLDAGLILGGAWCAVAGTVKLRVYNPTGATITPAAQNLKVMAH